MYIKDKSILGKTTLGIIWLIFQQAFYHIISRNAFTASDINSIARLVVHQTCFKRAGLNIHIIVFSSVFKDVLVIISSHDKAAQRISNTHICVHLYHHTM